MISILSKEPEVEKVISFFDFDTTISISIENPYIPYQYMDGYFSSIG
jgi:hypothetical protein